MKFRDTKVIKKTKHYFGKFDKRNKLLTSLISGKPENKTYGIIKIRELSTN